MIRPMVRADLEGVVDLYTYANPFARKQEIAEWTTELFVKRPQYHFVYVQAERVVGAISGKLTGSGVGVVNDVAVLPEYRGKNIGSKLLKKLLGAFEQDDIKKQQLMVFWPNAAAIPLYYRFGFKLKRVGHTEKGDVIYLERVSSER